MAEKKEEIKEMPKIIGNTTQGYGYKYVDLAGIAKAGVEIPPMRIATLTDGQNNPIIVGGQPVEYIEALVNGEWIRGARIVIPSMAKSNEAQCYGSALTYARRYTALTVLGIATDDDYAIEKHSEEDEKANAESNKESLKKLWIQASGTEEGFEDYYVSKKGNTNNGYAAIKAQLLKRINEQAEKKEEK